MLVGYMRVSTDSDRQMLDLQRDALVAGFSLPEDRQAGAVPLAADSEGWHPSPGSAVGYRPWATVFGCNQTMPARRASDRAPPPANRSICAITGETALS
jgi:hypothetical protein